VLDSLDGRRGLALLLALRVLLRNSLETRKAFSRLVLLLLVTCVQTNEEGRWYRCPWCFVAAMFREVSLRLKGQIWDSPASVFFSKPSVPLLPLTSAVCMVSLLSSDRETQSSPQTSQRKQYPFRSFSIHRSFSLWLGSSIQYKTLCCKIAYGELSMTT
jgi:hypothetical protein